MFYHDPFYRYNPMADYEFYHGSPYSSGQIEDFSSFDLVGNILFLTPCRHIAEEYRTPLMGAGRRPTKVNVENTPVVYTVRINIPDDQIFDTRKPAHAQIYEDMMEQLLAEDEDERYRDLVHTPWLPGCTVNTAGLLPSWGTVRVIRPLLLQRGFRATWINEGSQGASLALFHPEDAKIINIS